MRFALSPVSQSPLLHHTHHSSLLILVTVIALPRRSSHRLILSNPPAQWYSNKVTDDISPTALRAPETILHHYWDEKVDIWAIGCLVR